MLLKNFFLIIYTCCGRVCIERSRVTLVLLSIFSSYIHTHKYINAYMYVGHLSTKSRPYPRRFWFSANSTRTHLVLYNSGHSISLWLYRFSWSHPLYAVPGTTYSIHCVMCIYCARCFARIPHNCSGNRHQGLTVL